MNKSIFLLATLLTLASCGSKDAVAPGSGFTGKVKLTDEFGVPQADQSGVLVTVTDTSPQVTTQTGADGSYTLPNVPDGTHIISFSKTSYGTYFQANAFTDPHKLAPLATITLGQVSTTRTTLSRSYLKVGDMYLISGTVSPAPTATQPRPHRLFLQSYDNVLPSLPIANNYHLTLRGHTQADGSFVDTVTVAQLAAANIISGSGTDVHVWAAGDNPSASLYQDIQNGKTIYPCANLALNTQSMYLFTHY